MRKTLKELVEGGGQVFAAKYLRVRQGTISKWLRRDIVIDHEGDLITVKEQKVLKTLRLVDNRVVDDEKAS